MKFILASGQNDDVLAAFREAAQALAAPESCGYSDIPWEYISCNDGKVVAGAEHLRTGAPMSVYERADFVGGKLGLTPRSRVVVTPHSMHNQLGEFALEGSKIIYCAGGDSRIYLRCLRECRTKSGKTYLEKFCEMQRESKTVYVGVSAGAMVMGSSVDAFDYYCMKRQAQRNRAEPSALMGLGLVKAQIIPHFGRDKFLQNLIARWGIGSTLKEYARAHSRDVVGGKTFILLPDSAGLLIDGYQPRLSRVLGRGALLLDHGKKRPLTDAALQALTSHLSIPARTNGDCKTTLEPLG